jgi:hypothetical protein
MNDDDDIYKEFSKYVLNKYTPTPYTATTSSSSRRIDNTWVTHTPYPAGNDYKQTITLKDSNGNDVQISGDQIKDMILLMEAIEMLDDEDVLKSMFKLHKIMTQIKGNDDEAESV